MSSLLRAISLLISITGCLSQLVGQTTVLNYGTAGGDARADIFAINNTSGQGLSGHCRIGSTNGSPNYVFTMDSAMAITGLAEITRDVLELPFMRHGNTVFGGGTIAGLVPSAYVYIADLTTGISTVLDVTQARYSVVDNHGAWRQRDSLNFSGVTEAFPGAPVVRVMNVGYDTVQRTVTVDYQDDIALRGDGYLFVDDALYAYGERYEGSTAVLSGVTRAGESVAFDLGARVGPFGVLRIPALPESRLRPSGTLLVEVTRNGTTLPRLIDLERNVSISYADRWHLTLLSRAAGGRYLVRARDLDDPSAGSFVTFLAEDGTVNTSLAAATSSRLVAPVGANDQKLIRSEQRSTGSPRFLFAPQTDVLNLDGEVVATALPLGNLESDGYRGAVWIGGTADQTILGAASVGLIRSVPVLRVDDDTVALADSVSENSWTERIATFGDDTTWVFRYIEVDSLAEARVQLVGIDASGAVVSQRAWRHDLASGRTARGMYRKLLSPDGLYLTVTEQQGTGAPSPTPALEVWRPDGRGAARRVLFDDQLDGLDELPQWIEATASLTGDELSVFLTGRLAGTESGVRQVRTYDLRTGLRTLAGPIETVTSRAKGVAITRGEGGDVGYAVLCMRLSSAGSAAQAEALTYDSAGALLDQEATPVTVSPINQAASIDYLDNARPYALICETSRCFEARLDRDYRLQARTLPTQLPVTYDISAAALLDDQLVLAGRTLTADPLDQPYFFSRDVVGELVSSTSEATGSRASLSVAPNPAVERLNVDVSEVSLSASASLSISTLTGQEVYSEQVAPGQTALTLDLGGLPAGSYVLRLGEHSQLFTKL